MNVDPAIMQFAGQTITVGAVMTAVTQYVKNSPAFLKLVTKGNKAYVRMFNVFGCVGLYLVWSYFYSGDVFMLENAIGGALSIAVSAWSYDYIVK